MKGIVDRATAYMVPAYLSRPRSAAPNAWVDGPARAFTLLAVGAPHMTLAANLEQENVASGMWGLFVQELGGLAKPNAVSSDVRERALGRVKAELAAPEGLRLRIEQLRQDPAYDQWFEWHLDHEWYEHSARRGGFFDADFIDELATLQGVAPEDVRQAWLAYERPANVVELADGLRSGQLDARGRLAVDCWFAASVVRGIYHTEVARIQKAQIARHPIRRTAESVPAAALYRASSAQSAFAAILLGLARAPRRVEARIVLHARNLRAARDAALAQTLLLGDEPMTADEGMERAILETRRLVKRGVLSVDARSVAQAIEAALSTVVGAGTSFLLSPWEGFAAGSAAAAAQNKVGLGDRLALNRAVSEKRLRELGSGLAGAVDLG